MRSRSRSPHRWSRSGSPRRRSISRSRSRSLRRRSPRRSRTHSPQRRPVRRSRSRSRNRRSHSPRYRKSSSPRRRPLGRRLPSPRGWVSGRRSPPSRGDPPRRRLSSPRGKPQGRRSPRRSPKRISSGQRQGFSQHDDRRQQSPHSSTDIKRNRSSSHTELSPIQSRNSLHHERKERSVSPQHVPSTSIRHKSDFISGITVLTPMRRLLLSDRFQNDDQKEQGDIIIEDNIVIAIQRGPNVRNYSPVDINRDFDPNNVVIMRYKDEGKNPIFDREEIKVFGFDSILDENVYEERRIISVVPSATQTSSKRRHNQPEVIRKVQQQTRVKLDFKPDPRYEPLMKFKGEKEEEKEKVRIKRVQKNPNDLRHSLSKRRHDDDEDDVNLDARRKIEAKRKGPETGRKEADRVFDRLGIQSRERRRERSRERRPERSTSGRNKDVRSSRDTQDKGDNKNLPDFKNRPDKFQYEEWKEKPEMIPRNPSYFEHDNREGERGFRGRGRGFRGRPPPRGRGRGGFRGGGRGFGGSGRSYNKERESAWKHDLFDKLKDEEDEKPSSTTKN